MVLRTSPNYAAQAGQRLLQTLALSSFPGATWGKIGLLSLMSITEMYTIAVALSRGDPWSVTSTVNWWWACFSWSNATQFIISPEGQRKWGKKEVRYYYVSTILKTCSNDMSFDRPCCWYQTTVFQAPTCQFCQSKCVLVLLLLHYIFCHTLGSPKQRYKTFQTNILTFQTNPPVPFFITFQDR